MEIYLYVKTHNITGLKYFGKTTKDPFRYKGSGKVWSQHLRDFGDNVSTEIVGHFTNREECAIAARRFSEENDIANSDKWANLIPETLGGWNTNPHKGKQTMYERYGADYYKRIATRGRDGTSRTSLSEETKEKIRNHPNCSIGGKKNQGLVREKVKCPHCMKEGARNVMLRWHFENCKMAM